MTRGAPFFAEDSEGPLEKGEMILQTDILDIYRYEVAHHFVLNGRPMRGGAEVRVALFIGYSKPGYRIVALFLCHESAYATVPDSRPASCAKWSESLPPARPSAARDLYSMRRWSRFDASDERAVRRWLASLGASGFPPHTVKK